MKDNVHPTWYPEAKVSCVCGNSFTVGSTLASIRIEICANCHPFYTGQQKLLDSKGQVEKFTKNRDAAQVKQVERAKINDYRASKIQKTQGEKPSLKDLLLQARKSSAS